MVKNSPKIGVFCRFGGSAALAEASAEAVRPKMTEASAEASVSVVHYYVSMTVAILYACNHLEKRLNLGTI